MSSVTCSNNHIYNNEQYTHCPFCEKNINDQNLNKTVQIFDDPQDITKSTNDDYTVSRRDPDEIMDLSLPVVGWLICIEGNQKGRDFRLHSGRNHIGRSSKMDVSIPDDNDIARQNHAMISYNSKTNLFKLYVGESRVSVDLNGIKIDSDIILTSRDILKIGNTKLIFIPFCDEKFTW
jgi:hypothetical protein